MCGLALVEQLLVGRCLHPADEFASSLYVFEKGAMWLRSRRKVRWTTAAVYDCVLKQMFKWTFAVVCVNKSISTPDAQLLNSTVNVQVDSPNGIPHQQGTFA